MKTEQKLPNEQFTKEPPVPQSMQLDAQDWLSEFCKKVSLRLGTAYQEHLKRCPPESPRTAWCAEATLKSVLDILTTDCELTKEELFLIVSEHLGLNASIPAPYDLPYLAKECPSKHDLAP